MFPVESIPARQIALITAFQLVFVDAVLCFEWSFFYAKKKVLYIKIYMDQIE